MERFMDRKMMFWTGYMVASTVMLVLGQCSSRLKEADRKNPEITKVVAQDINDDGVRDLVVYSRGSPIEAYIGMEGSFLYRPSQDPLEQFRNRSVKRSSLESYEKKWDLNGDGFIDADEERRALQGSITGGP